MKQALLFLNIFLLVSQGEAKVGMVLSDTVKAPLFVGAAVHYGSIIAHTPQMAHLITGHSWGTEIMCERRTWRRNEWQQQYGLPFHGIRYFFMETGNSKAFGQQHSLSYTLRLPLDVGSAIRKAPVNGEYRPYHFLMLGLGVGYASRVWHLRENHQAPVIGSHINAALSLAYQWSKTYNSGLALNLGLRVTHFSNGSFKVPNLGTNNCSIYMGIQYGKKESKVCAVPERRNRGIIKPMQFFNSLSFSAGAKEIAPPLGKKFAAFELSYLHDWRMTFKSSIGLGLDLLYNTSLAELMKRLDDYSPRVWQSVQAGTVFSYTLHFNMFELKIQQGIYVMDKWKQDGLLYHRFGLRYHFSKRLFAQVMLKTHFARADYGMVGIGYGLSQ